MTLRLPTSILVPTIHLRWPSTIARWFIPALGNKPPLVKILPMPKILTLLWPNFKAPPFLRSFWNFRFQKSGVGRPRELVPH